MINSSFDQFHSIITLYLTDNYSSILSQLRILYETFIVFSYLKLHPDLTKSFVAHGNITKYKTMELLNGVLEAEDEAAKNKLLDIYDIELLEDYGWLKDLIPNKNDRKLITLVNDLGLRDYNSLYKITSNFIHTSSFSVFMNDNIDDNFIHSFLATASDLQTDIIIMYLDIIKCPEKERLIIMDLIHRLREELLDEPERN